MLTRMQLRQNIIVLSVVFLTISSCLENTVAQQSPDRIIQIGELSNANKVFDTKARVAFLLTDSILPDGVMFAISADYRSLKPVHFQVWRPTDVDSTYTLVWQQSYTSPYVGVRHDIYFYEKNETLCYHFRRGDRVGVFIDELPGAIPYEFNAKAHTIHTDHQLDLSFQIGNTTRFDPINFPYDFSVKAYIDTVEDQYVNDTRDRVPCPESTIPVQSAPRGATGHTGPRGPTGATGPKGDRGPAGRAWNGTGTAWAVTSDETKVMSIAALVWLCLLTIAVIIIFIILIYCFIIRRRQNDDDVFDTEGVTHHDKRHSVSRQRSKTSATDDSIWFKDLKEETESTYSIHTMKETTPLSKTGPFVFEGPYEPQPTDSNSSQQSNAGAGSHVYSTLSSDTVATLDVSAAAAQY